MTQQISLSIFTDFPYQSIKITRLLSIFIDTDFYRLSTPGCKQKSLVYISVSYMTWTHYRVLDHYWDVSQITNLSAKNNKLKVRWKYIYFHHLIDRPVQVNDFQRLPARLLPFFPHNFLPQQRAVNILASRINCLSHPRKTVNRHATSPIFTTNHGRFIKISIWLPSRVEAASGLGRLEN